MKEKALYIFVEGPDDERFFNELVRPRFEEQYKTVSVLRYRGETSDWVTRFIRTIKKMRDEYIFVADLNSSPCVTEKKIRLTKEYKNIEQANILVIRVEIESWYLAGLDGTTAKNIGLRLFPNTDSVTKEQFNNRQPKRFDSRIDFMREILKVYSVAEAKQRNASLKYFAEKYKLDP